MMMACYKPNALELVLANLGEYVDAGTMLTEQVGQDAAEEMFDLTNNPSRQKERELSYGRGRSISSGDVIEVDKVRYLCMPAGWAVI